MDLSRRLNLWYTDAKDNKWYHYFAVFCRVTLALGFIIAGVVKIRGERFASGLSVNNPMGHYLEALYYTEYYYTFIGIVQVIIALLLLLPGTALLGALMYFPIILNICILAYAVRFEGSRITTCMLLANLYLLGWDYDRLKAIFKQDSPSIRKKPLSGKFPFLFFGMVIATIAAIIIINLHIYDIRPGNAPDECINGCPGNSSPEACEVFCDCIYNRGKPLHECLLEYNKARGANK